MDLYPIIFTVFQIINMSNCHNVLDVATIERQYLRPNKMTIDDYAYQLTTNHAFVYKLPDSTIVLLPNGWRSEEEGFVLENEKCLQDMIDKDYFPINDSESIYSKKRYEMLELHQWIPKYQNILNECIVLKEPYS